MSPAIELIVSRYRASTAGRSADATRDLIIPFNELLKEADCLHGPARHEALSELEELEKKNVLVLERHSRDRSAILKVRLALSKAPELFSYLGLTSPEKEREDIANLFHQASENKVPLKFQAGWESFCREIETAARSGSSMQPFDRSKPRQIADIMQALPRILAWEGESLVRFASSLLFHDSKLLESLRSRIQLCLERISGGEVQSLADLGIIENERSFLLHGPVSLVFENGGLQLGLLANLFRIGREDIRRGKIVTQATRCLTVENAAMLHELAKLRSDTILASSGSEGGFSNSAVIAFLCALPPEIQLWHFGDSDPKGFDILRDLREKTGKPIKSLHMMFRETSPSADLTDEDLQIIERLLGSPLMTVEEKSALTAMRNAKSKGAFEQESLGIPASNWPFFK